MAGKKTRLQILIDAIRNKKTYVRILIFIAILGIFAYVLFADHSCKTKYFQCDSKSKFKVEVTK